MTHSLLRLRSALLVVPAVLLLWGTTDALAAPAKGIVTVNSTPEGVPFDLVGPNNIVYAGVTPASFSDLPVAEFRVQWGHLDHCITPKPQRRIVDLFTPVHFIGRYICDTPDLIAAPDAPLFVEEGQRGHTSMWLKPHQLDTVPGGEMVFTLGVRNHSKTTQHDLTAVFQFDPNTMTPANGVPGNPDVLDGNIVWHIPELFAGQTWTTHVPVQIASTLGYGRQIEVTGYVDGPEIDPLVSGQLTETASARLADQTVVIGTPVIPQAGARKDALLLVLSVLAALGSTLLIRRKSQQV